MTQRLGLRRATLAAALISAIAAGPASAQLNTLIFDGFGDADLNNNGTPLEDFDTNVGGSGTELTVGPDDTYVPSRLDGLFDGGDATLINPEVTSVLDASDTGIKWFGIRGFTSGIPGTGSPSPTVSIVDDSLGMMQETMTTGAGALSIPAIDDGYALAVESRGGGLTSAGFFDEPVQLGPNVGDEVRVSFDFRFWRDAPNANSPANNEPIAGELRFGLFQDTDNQLGQTNNFAGRQEDLNMDGFPDFTPAVWGEEEGEFSGQLITDLFGGINSTPPTGEIGTFGDNGWTASAFFGNSVVPNGGGVRIREELQADEILQGSDVHTIAQPPNLNPDPFGVPVFDFATLDNDTVYNIALSLVRDTIENPGDTITATLTYTEKATGTVVGTLSGSAPLEDATSSGLPVPGTGGVQSDSWDYFAIRNASNGSSEFDFLLDNFLIETSDDVGGGIPGDFDGDGDVDDDDFGVFAGAFGGAGPLGDFDMDGDVDDDDFGVFAGNFGTGVPSSAIPEPTAVSLAALAMLLTAGRRTRS